MRIFDDLASVKAYFAEKEAEARTRMASADELRKQTRRGSKDWLIYEAEWRYRAGVASSYLDAREALGEIRPGLIEAFESGGFTVTLPDIPDTIEEP